MLVTPECIITKTPRVRHVERYGHSRNGMHMPLTCTCLSLERCVHSRTLSRTSCAAVMPMLSFPSCSSALRAHTASTNGGAPTGGTRPSWQSSCCCCCCVWGLAPMHSALARSVSMDTSQPGHRLRDSTQLDTSWTPTVPAQAMHHMTTIHVWACAR
jgi:hypothetical protein